MDSFICFQHHPQVRFLALEAGKLVMVPQPRLRTGQGQGTAQTASIYIALPSFLNAM